MSVYRNHPGAYELDNAPNPLTGEKWGGYYCRHVGALTEEDMHSKAEIAAELAHRDLQIDNLRAELAECRDAIAGILAVVGDSSGVCGYHLNGDAAEWGEFPEVDALIDIARKGEGE